jgi:uncharacterized Tic20 family protein
MPLVQLSVGVGLGLLLLRQALGVLVCWLVYRHVDRTWTSQHKKKTIVYEKQQTVIFFVLTCLCPVHVSVEFNPTGMPVCTCTAITWPNSKPLEWGAFAGAQSWWQGR